MRDELLALLEDGPKLVPQLAGWLEQPDAQVTKALRGLNKAALVKRLTHDPSRWALMTYLEPPVRPKPSAHIKHETTDDWIPPPADDVDEDEAAAVAAADAVLKPRRQKPIVAIGPGSWWLGKETREDFAAAARLRNLQLQHDPKWRATAHVNFRPNS